MTTEAVKQFIVNTPVIMKKKTSSFTPSILHRNSMSSTAVEQSVAETGLGSYKKSKKEQIFVDIFDKLTVLFNSNGAVINSSIDGVVQMKSYLKGNPQLRLHLNENLVVGGDGSSYGMTVLDDCSFHECVDATDFESMKTLTINPPDGEFLVMNYRITGEFQQPFRIYPFIEEISPFQVQVTIKVRSTFPADHQAKNVNIKFPVPAACASYGTGKLEVGQTSQHFPDTNIVVWNIKAFSGMKEQVLTCKLSLKSAFEPSMRKEIGPISMNFDIHMFNVSNVTVKSLKIASLSKKYSPHRWVRYVTQSSSYVCRT